MQPVDGLGGDVDRCVEAEGEVGATQVVVDRLGHSDDVDAQVGEPGRDPQGVLAADGDEGVDTVGLEVGGDLLDATIDLEGVGARRAQDGAATGQDAAHLGDAQLARHVLQWPAPSVAEADEVEAVVGDSLADDGPDDRIEPRAVTATGQHSDAHVRLLLDVRNQQRRH